MTADDPKYWAFISYSHRDAKVARALQRALETYRLPGRLIGTATAGGTIPEYVKPVFRDRDEMEAGADLKATVREALRQSRYLIVVCSPDAARSPWVNQEIVEFKKLTGESRVLALIASGEPYASRMAGREVEECFPDALRFALDAKGLPRGAALEPIAADLRPQGDGKRLAILKLVAGMVGVGVDSLVRRDAQRRARRLAYVASGAVAGMAVMAVLTVMAVQSRIEAQKQRAQAEDLIEFMLGDLRKKLDPVGRLDVLDSVGEKALGYYAKQDTDKLDANSLGRRSRAMHLIGELREKQGKLDEAEAAFKSAADTTSALLARSPNDGQRIFDHAQSVYWVGYIARRGGKTGEAEEAFRKYLELARALVQAEPSNVEWKLEGGYAAQNLGVVLIDRNKPLDALASFAEARRIETEVAKSKPELVLEAAKTIGWVAVAQDNLGRIREAIDSQREKIETVKAVADYERNRQAQYLVSNGYFEIGKLELELGDTFAAAENARNSVEIIDSLVATDPANLFWLTESCIMRLTLAESELESGNRTMTRDSIERARIKMSQLLANEKATVRQKIFVQGRYLELAARAGTLNPPSSAASDMEKFLDFVTQNEKRGLHLTAQQTAVTASIDASLGDLLELQARHIDAISHWENAVSRLRPLAQADNLPATALLARTFNKLGNKSEAQRFTLRLKNSSYRHPAFADLYI